MDFKRIVQQWLLLMIGIFVASKLVSGIHYETTGAVVAVVLILSFFNLVVRPLLILFALPFVILSLGFGILVINALLFFLVGEVVSGFHVDSFWSAFWGAVIVSVTGFLANLMLGEKQVEVQMNSRSNSDTRDARVSRLGNDDDVIDL